jgi:hypothetical protein
MHDSSVVLIPSKKTLCTQVILGGGFCALALGGLIYSTTGFARLAFESGLLVAFVGSAISGYRFRRWSPLKVSIDDEMISIQYSKGGHILRLDKIDEAIHSTFLGRKWKVISKELMMIIYDDGIRTSDWCVFSARLSEELGLRDKRISIDRYMKIQLLLSSKV